jgi:hypothetical protein
MTGKLGKVHTVSIRHFSVSNIAFEAKQAHSAPQSNACILDVLRKLPNITHAAWGSIQSPYMLNYLLNSKSPIRFENSRPQPLSLV